MTAPLPDTAVFGATGLIGRWLLLHLLAEGRAVAAVLRDPARSEEDLRTWLREHDTPDDRLTVVTGDVTGGPSLGLTPADDVLLTGVRDVHNTAGLYRFGLGREEARAANVDGALNVLHWAATRTDLRRLVHVSGYRVGLDPEPRYPIPEPELSRLYREKGAYEGSKTESDAAVRVLAAELGVPLTVVNPSTVIGHSATGEAGQYIGLADLVRDIWRGRLPALPGDARTFVPVTTVDHLARFMAMTPVHDHEPGGAHWILNPDTPELPGLVRLLAGHLGVKAPKRHIPVSLLRRLPAWLTGADPETLGFLTDERYDTASAERLAATAGLAMPPVEESLLRWADRLVADGFGDSPTTTPGGFHDVAGARTYLAGDRVAPAFVLLHGLPLDGESWRGVLGELGEERVLVADLPGLGRSAPSTAGPAEWLADLLAPVRSRPVIVAHSAASGPAIRYAAAHPDRIGGLVLVSPYFLQKRASWPLRTPLLAGPVLRRMSADRLTATLVGADATGGARVAVASAAAQLRRPGVARRTARFLRDAQRTGERAGLLALLGGFERGRVHLIAGEEDPLVGDPGPVAVTVIPGAGHDPQLTHAAAVAKALRDMPSRAGLRSTRASTMVK
ncbi:alpha/beta fold hydrolase [Phytomonospora endophytica]|uniref:Pimeloyl-ACP methyl ester carboxylesterase/nucleoside-diphosphate-sugar epimerase n=1 Tax=Phytomonospora endophytica TaxID=714109 RepID=A0A841FK50_9ACTN|nr:alpha/beta fold hydrolase [Phytomonospora endophytica]MBB6034208.1 pimeloyl-ACP methyl ester carboxylesterase/nucleoside-diphosphate-sugar epimerase [Phytomonospora endophytica]GIG66600.1 bifunctional protein [Phytomonospora endophytica]